MSEIELEDLGDGVVAVIGELDAHSAPVLTRALADQSDHGVVRVVLSKCTFMDSSGLRAILSAHTELEARGGRLIVVTPSRAVQRLFEITGVHDSLHIDSSAS